MELFKQAHISPTEANRFLSATFGLQSDEHRGQDQREGPGPRGDGRTALGGEAVQEPKGGEELLIRLVFFFLGGGAGKWGVKTMVKAQKWTLW